MNVTSSVEAKDVAMRYITAALEAHREGKHYPEFTMDELDSVRIFVNSRFSEDEHAILHVYDSIVSEFTKGHRCGVCGRTSAQNEAIGYDCTNEC